MIWLSRQATMSFGLLVCFLLLLFFLFPKTNADVNNMRISLSLFFFFILGQVMKDITKQARKKYELKRKRSREVLDVCNGLALLCIDLCKECSVSEKGPTGASLPARKCAKDLGATCACSFARTEKRHNI